MKTNKLDITERNYDCMIGTVLEIPLSLVEFINLDTSPRKKIV